VSVREKLQAFLGNLNGEHDAHRSWEYCYRYFHHCAPKILVAERDQGALQLGFYLASWGMYRGSSFPPSYTYTIHCGVIDQLCSSRFAELWRSEFGSGIDDVTLLTVVLDAVDTVRAAYQPFAFKAGASDILVSKVLLGTLGCLPATDRYFVKGFKQEGNRYSYLNRAFLEEILGFCSDNLSDLRAEQEQIRRVTGIHYPIMKLVDMYFWQLGYESFRRPL
jgi:hypothetical protein